MDDKIREVLAEQGKLPIDIGAIADDADLFEAGLTSHASVNVMLALEDSFDIEFPDEMLRKSTFESVQAIREALTTLGVTLPAAP
jgi:acyl carrier protein